ncbi:unnamed protein product [Paramecium pentaurelia]|uniref:Uncharacterized protein n=1 Tax=Paramecium pentaurelia TaxID=43138 RepID=A0A8S1SY09_9CILI|nr:unnamed protein product [Paramecium pentaurelia]
MQVAETFRNVINLCYNLQYQQAQQMIIALYQQINYLILNNPLINLIYQDLQQSLKYYNTIQQFKLFQVFQ